MKKTIVSIFILAISSPIFAGSKQYNIKNCLTAFGHLYEEKLSDALDKLPQPKFDASPEEFQKRAEQAKKDAAPYEVMFKAGIELCKGFNN